MSERTYVKGLYAKEPRSNAPDFVKGSVSVKFKDFMDFCREWRANNPNEEWLNIQLLSQKNSPEKWSAVLDDWKPNQGGQAQGTTQPAPQTADANYDDSDLPF